MGEIEFKGELHTIPAGAALVLKVDRELTADEAECIREQLTKALGPDHKVLVIGPGLTPIAVGMDMASGPDTHGYALVDAKEGLFKVMTAEEAEAHGLRMMGYTPGGLQRLEVKDTMSREDVARVFGVDPALLGDAAPSYASVVGALSERAFAEASAALAVTDEPGSVEDWFKREGVQFDSDETRPALSLVDEKALLDMGAEVLDHPINAAAKARLDESVTATRAMSAVLAAYAGKPLNLKIVGTADPQPRAVTLLPEEADEDGRPELAAATWSARHAKALADVRVGFKTTEASDSKALPANANLMKVR
jgi:hypothetical protein